MKIYTPGLWQRGIKASLLQAEKIVEPSLIGVVATRVESESNDNAYAWIGEAPTMKAMTRELEVAGLSDTTYTLTNGTHAIALEIGRDDLHDDQIGGQMQRVQEMALVAKNYPNKLITTGIINGTSLLCYDGQEFFDDAHPARGQLTATQDNLLAGTGVTVATVKADLAAAIAARMNWKAENGEPLAGGSKFLVMVPPALLHVANEAVYSAIIAQTSNEAFRGLRIEVAANARFTDANDWYLFDVSNPGGLPMICQVARDLDVEFLGPGSDYYVIHEKALVKVSWRGAVGYGKPGLAMKTVNS